MGIKRKDEICANCSLIYPTVFSLESWFIRVSIDLYQNIKLLRNFVFLKPLQGSLFDSQKYRHTFLNWYYTYDYYTIFCIDTKIYLD